jgi:uncharacterized protein (TIGR03437 family)
MYDGRFMRPAGFFIPALLPLLLPGQLVSPGAIPKGLNPPVVFLNGYQNSCTGGTFAGTFGAADQVLQASQIATVFFDNCTITGTTSAKPSIEALAAGFGQFLAALKYADGTAVPQVDVVAHSMGGLIVRTYLAGKKDVSPAVFAPPVNPGIRKAVFLATPHFGSAIATQLGGDTQTNEMALGSQFLFDLNTWNAGYDDLRGVDALAVAGNGGTGLDTMIPGFDDGVVALTSASLAFVRTGRTRVVPTCHANISLLVTFGFCPATAPPIALIADSTSVVGQMIVSFLIGTDAWQSLGQAIEQNTVASATGGTIVRAEDLNGNALQISSGSVTAASGQINLGESSDKLTLYSEGLAAKVPLPLQVQTASTLNSTITLPATTETAVILKPGPLVHGVVPAGSAVFPYSVTSGAYVAIYGTNLASSTTRATTLPYPTQLSDVQVTVNGADVPIQYVSPTQINIIFPDLAPGSTQLTVTNGAGRFTSTVVISAAVPSIFSLDGTGNGVAAAVNNATTQVVTSSSPLHTGDYVDLYLTGLGATTPRNGLDYAQNAPTLMLNGQNCAIVYAGRVPGVPGLDQVTCQIPAGITGPAVPVFISSAGRTSNTVTLTIQ